MGKLEIEKIVNLKKSEQKGKTLSKEAKNHKNRKRCLEYGSK
jgi:hypothetical protein